MQHQGDLPTGLSFHRCRPINRAVSWCTLNNNDWLGWAASAVLLLTLARQVWVQWRERSTQGVSSWLFFGQVLASVGFTAYSALIGNPVFVVTNTAILLTAVAGQCVYRRNLKLEASGEAAN